MSEHRAQHKANREEARGTADDHGAVAPHRTRPERDPVRRGDDRNRVRCGGSLNRCAVGSGPSISTPLADRSRLGRRCVRAVQQQVEVRRHGDHG